MRAMACITSIEWPPRSKKLSSDRMSSVPSRSAQTPVSVASIEPASSAGRGASAVATPSAAASGDGVAWVCTSLPCSVADDEAVAGMVAGVSAAAEAWAAAITSRAAACPVPIPSRAGVAPEGAVRAATFSMPISSPKPGWCTGAADEGWGAAARDVVVGVDGRVVTGWSTPQSTAVGMCVSMSASGVSGALSSQQVSSSW